MCLNAFAILLNFVNVCVILLYSFILSLYLIFLDDCCILKKVISGFLLIIYIPHYD